MTAENSNRGRLRVLDILRAVAVFLVLGRHMELTRDAGPWLGGIVDVWKRGGWVGVDLFFVLSGFLVSGLFFREWEERGSVNITRFLVRRGLKIYPPFYCLIAITTVTLAFTGHPMPVLQLFGELLFVQNYTHNYWGHTWSLAVEEHFYFLLAFIVWLLLIIPATKGVNRFRVIPILFGAVGCFCLVARVITNVWLPFDDNTHVFQTHVRIDSLLFGVLLCYLWSRHMKQMAEFSDNYRWALGVFAAVVFLFPFLFNLKGSMFLTTVGFTGLYLASGAVILAFLPLQPAGRFVSAVAFMGSRSYSIYLWHVPVKHVLENSWPTSSLGWNTQTALYFVCSIGVGILMAELIEYPALRMRERFFPSDKKSLLVPAPIRLQSETSG